MRCYEGFDCDNEIKWFCVACTQHGHYQKPDVARAYCDPHVPRGKCSNDPCSSASCNKIPAPHVFANIDRLEHVLTDPEQVLERWRAAHC